MDLIERVRKGDQEAEQELLLRYIEQIRSMVCHQIGERNEYLDDLTNEICMALIENLRNGKFDPAKAKLGSYIYGIARNKVVDFQSRKSDATSEDISDQQIPAAPEITQQLEDEELLEIMRRELTHLKTKYRKVLLLRYYMERSIGEIAETLGISTDQVSERIYYAKQMLRKKCQKFFPEN